MVAESGPVIFQVVFLTLCLILMALPAMRIVSMYLEQQISGLELLLYCSVLLGFVAGIVKTWGSSTSWLLGLMYITLCALYPVWERVANRRAHRRLDDEEIERCENALVFDPKNASAMAKLGDIYYARGDIDRAIDYYQRSLDVWKDARVKLRLQHAVQRKRLAETGNVICYKCGTESPKGTVLCPKCGATISGGTDIMEYFASSNGKRMLAWMIGVSLLLGLGLAFIPAMPAIARNFLFLLAFAGTVLYGYVRAMDL